MRAHHLSRPTKYRDRACRDSGRLQPYHRHGLRARLEAKGCRPSSTSSVLRLDPYDLKDQVAPNNHFGPLAQAREMYFITCWYLYRTEDLAIWEQYGHDGVAVTSSYGLLKESLMRHS
jgi:hypothetical protein